MKIGHVNVALYILGSGLLEVLHSVTDASRFTMLSCVRDPRKPQEVVSMSAKGRQVTTGLGRPKLQIKF